MNTETTITVTELADQAGTECKWNLNDAMSVFMELLAEAPEELREAVYAAGCRAVLGQRRSAFRTQLVLNAAPLMTLVKEDDGRSRRLKDSVRSSLYGWPTSDGGRALGDCTRSQVLAQAKLYGLIASKNRARELYFYRIAAIMTETGIVRDQISSEKLASLLTELKKEEVAA